MLDEGIFDCLIPKERQTPVTRACQQPGLLWNLIANTMANRHNNTISDTSGHREAVISAMPWSSDGCCGYVGCRGHVGCRGLSELASEGHAAWSGGSGRSDWPTSRVAFGCCAASDHGTPPIRSQHPDITLQTPNSPARSLSHSPSVATFVCSDKGQCLPQPSLPCGSSRSSCTARTPRRGCLC